MKTNKFAEQYDVFENGLIARFRRHPFWHILPALSNRTFLDYLLQLSHVASHFVRWYDKAKKGFESVAAKDVIRDILRDEIPLNAPTHQDDLLEDLLMMGLPKKEILLSRESSATEKVIALMYRLIQYGQSHYDLRVLVTLRVAGEVLVSEQYEHVVREMGHRFGIRPEQSYFYEPHRAHDAKDQGGEGHSDAFDDLLATLIVDEATLKIAQEAAEKAARIRFNLHDQFLPRQRLKEVGTRFVRWMAAAAAMVLVAIFICDMQFKVDALAGEVQQEREERQVWQAVAGTNEFYRKCDALLVSWYHKTGDKRWLAKVGTTEGPRELWGDGP